MGRAVLRKYDVVLDIVQRLITIRNNQWDYQIVEGFEERPEEIRSWKKSSEAKNEIRKRFFVGMACQQFRYLESVLLGLVVRSKAMTTWRITWIITSNDRGGDGRR